MSFPKPPHHCKLWTCKLTPWYSCDDLLSSLVSALIGDSFSRAPADYRPLFQVWIFNSKVWGVSCFEERKVPRQSLPCQRIGILWKSLFDTAPIRCRSPGWLFCLCEFGATYPPLGIGQISSQASIEPLPGTLAFYACLLEGWSCGIHVWISLSLHKFIVRYASVRIMTLSLL